MRLRIFIGSSTEKKPYAERIQEILLEAGHEVLSWWTAFPPGVTYIEAIERAARETNAAILIGGADDKSTMRGQESWVPRDNILFEHGYFAARHGRERVALVTFTKKPVRLPSDLSGVSNLQLQRPKPESDMRQFTELSRPKIQDWIAALVGPRESDESVRKAAIPSGSIKALLLDEIEPRLDRASQIDILGLYRGFDIHRGLDKFRASKRSRLRLCLLDAWDKATVAMYRRKIDHEPKYFRDAVADSIARFVGPGKMKDTFKPDKPVPGDFDVRLTQARITYDYCRVDDVALLIPLDMKTNQNPPPPALLITKGEHPDLFAFYLGDFNAMFKESRSVYASRRTARSSKR